MKNIGVGAEGWWGRWVVGDGWVLVCSGWWLVGDGWRLVCSGCWVLGGRAGGWWVMVGVHKVVTSG